MKKIAINGLFLFSLVWFFEGSLANDVWNVDHNRLEMESWNQRPRYRSRATHEKYTNYKRPQDKRQSTDDEEEIAYNHYSPQIITAPRFQARPAIQRQRPSLYKPLEDPSHFYKNRIFLNMTEAEKRQRQGIPRVLYANNANSYQPKVTKTADRLSIRLNGATVHVRSSDSTLRKNQQKTMDSRYDVPYSDSVAKNSYFRGSTCVRCPAERTVVTGKGLDKAILVEPQLQGCGSSLPPIGAEFKVLYGPRIGDLLDEGSHITVGVISVNNQTLQHCNYRYNVVVRRCPTLTLSPGVEAECRKGALWGSACHFSCTLKEHRMKGRKMVFCKDDLEWSAPTPKCQEFQGSWCSMKHISRHGKVTCDTPKFDETIPASGVPEGSVCSVLCYGGQKSEAPKIITCKAGKWQGRPVCKKSRRRRHKASRRHPQQQDMNERSPL